MTPSRGVVFVATGDRYYAEALVSAASLRASNPGLPVAIMTDTARGSPLFDHEMVIPEPKFTMADKCTSLSRSPFEQTLYLDADTYVAADIADLFEILERIDVAGAHEVARGYWYGDKVGVPAAFPEFNGGVLLFGRNERVDRFLQLWVRLFWETQEWLGRSRNSWEVNNDQVSLQLALWRSGDLKIAALPTEYNALRNWGTYLWGEARIIHGRGDLRRLARQFNASNGIERVYLQEFGMWARPENVASPQLWGAVARFLPALVRAAYRRALLRIKRS